MNIYKTRGYPYILYYEMEVASLFIRWLVSGGEQKVFGVYLCWTRGRLSIKSTVTTILLLKTYRKWFSWYCLPCSFKVFTLYVKASCKEICEEISFRTFFQKNARKMRGYPSFSLRIPIALTKIYFFPRGLNLAQKPLYLVGTVLKINICLRSEASRENMLVSMRQLSDR